MRGACLTENVLNYAKISCGDEKYKPKSYNPSSRRSCLCLHEKLEIVDNLVKILLNKRSEVISQCHHRIKYKLKTLVTSKKDRGII